MGNTADTKLKQTKHLIVQLYFQDHYRKGTYLDFILVLFCSKGPNYGQSWSITNLFSSIKKGYFASEPEKLLEVGN